MASSHPADEIFEEALRLPLGPRRSAYLDEACGADLPMRQRIERLLEAAAQAGSYLEAPAVPALVPTIEAPPTERIGSVVGSYKLLEQIGEGGFGVVFMAEQIEPIRRKVALKILKPGMDSR